MALYPLGKDEDMKSPKLMVSASDRAAAQYQATLIGLAVRQALAEDRAIRAGVAGEPALPLVPFELPTL